MICQALVIEDDQLDWGAFEDSMTGPMRQFIFTIGMTHNVGLIDGPIPWVMDYAGSEIRPFSDESSRFARRLTPTSIDNRFHRFSVERTSFINDAFDGIRLRR
jgi:hypothetical protein